MLEMLKGLIMKLVMVGGLIMMLLLDLVMAIAILLPPN